MIPQSLKNTAPVLAFKHALPGITQHINSAVTHWVESRRIKKATDTAIALGYVDLELLGKGKDSVIFKARLSGATHPGDLSTTYVIKILSEYGLSYIETSKKLQHLCNHHLNDALCPLEVVNGSFFRYPYEPLKTPSNYTIREFGEFFCQLCSLQQSLIQHGLVIWDFGFESFNYLITASGKIKWIDYGGASFLELEDLDRTTLPGGMPFTSKDKNTPDSIHQYLHVAVLLHWCRWILGDLKSTKIMSECRRGKIDIESAKHYAIKKIMGTSLVFFESLNPENEAKLTTKAGWDNLSQFITQNTQALKLHTLEAADIDEVVLDIDKVTVKGYQNYTIEQQRLTPKKAGHRWAPSEQKWRIVDGIISDIEKDFDPNSTVRYLDIGSNLGLYVFSACINHKFSAAGVDYNPSYIDQCRAINEHLDLGCQFYNEKFSNLKDQYDCVSALGIIHHLFQRTENYNSLAPVFEQFSRLCNRYLIIEFPTEQDLKAKKWTRLHQQESEHPYTEAQFLKESENYFDVKKKYAGVVKDRPIYCFLRKKLR